MEPKNLRGGGGLIEYSWIQKFLWQNERNIWKVAKFLLVRR